MAGGLALSAIVGVGADEHPPALVVDDHLVEIAGGGAAQRARELALRVRAGDGPRFLWARTYRLAGHTAADPGSYRSEAEVAERWRQDPIAGCLAALRAAGVEDRAIEAARSAAAAEIAEAFEIAKAAAWPEPAAAFTDVQDLDAPAGDGRHG